MTYPAPYFLPALLPFSASQSSEQPHGWCFLRILHTTSPQSCAPSRSPLGAGLWRWGPREAQGTRTKSAPCCPFPSPLPAGPLPPPESWQGQRGPVTGRLLTDLHRVTLGGEVGLGEFLPVRGWASSTCFPVWPLSPKPGTGPRPQHLQLEGPPRCSHGILPACRHSSAPATQDR